MRLIGKAFGIPTGRPDLLLVHTAALIVAHGAAERHRAEASDPRRHQRAAARRSRHRKVAVPQVSRTVRTRTHCVCFHLAVAHFTIPPLRHNQPNSSTVKRRLAVAWPQRLAQLLRVADRSMCGPVGAAD